METRADDRREPLDEIRQRFPGFREAVLGDARVTAAYRGERSEFRGSLDALVQAGRLCIQADAFLAQVLYRVKASLQARGVPFLPRIAHRLAMAFADLSIGDPVVVQPGVYVVHGGVVIDGQVEIGSEVTIAPWVTIGLRAGVLRGPTIEPGVQIGTGAKVIGPVRVGEGAVIGANAVVTGDVPAGVTAVGAPARALQR